MGFNSGFKALIYIVHLFGYFHNCITMHGSMNVKFMYVGSSYSDLLPQTLHVFNKFQKKKKNIATAEYFYGLAWTTHLRPQEDSNINQKYLSLYEKYERIQRQNTFPCTRHPNSTLYHWLGGRYLFFKTVPYLCLIPHIFVYICICVNQHQMVHSYANNGVRGPGLENFQHEKHVNARHSENRWLNLNFFSKDIVEI